MDKTKEYKRLRSKGWSASQAWSRVNTLTAWNDMDGYIHGDEWDAPPDDDEKTVRLRLLWDHTISYDDLAGDCFDPKYHPNKRALVAEEKAFKAKIEQDGVWCLVSEYWNGEAWEWADACGGFVGMDWQESGYDADCMQTAIEAFNSQAHCPTCGRPNSPVKP